MSLTWILLALKAVRLMSQTPCMTFLDPSSCPSKLGCFWDGVSCQAVFSELNGTYYLNLPQTDNWAEHQGLEAGILNTTWKKLQIVGVPPLGNTSILINLSDATFSVSTCDICGDEICQNGTCYNEWGLFWHPFYGCNNCSREFARWGMAHQCFKRYIRPAELKVNLKGTPFSYVPDQPTPFGHLRNGKSVACSENNQVCEAGVQGYCSDIGWVVEMRSFPIVWLSILDREAYDDAVKAIVNNESLVCGPDEYRHWTGGKETIFQCERCGAALVDYSNSDGFCKRRARGECVGNLANLKEKTGSCNPFERISGSYNSIPAFVDWDTDGDLDVVVGSTSGLLRFFEHNIDHEVEEVVPSPFDIINNIAIGTCHDMDYFLERDGFNCSDYERRNFCANGTYGPRWNPRYGTFGDWGAAPLFRNAGQACCACGKSAGFAEFAAPALVDWDGDTNLDVIVGSMYGPLWYFKSSDDGSFVDHTEVGDTPFSTLDVDFFSVPTSIDWDGDGDLDLAVGGDNGGVRFFERISSTALRDLKGRSNPFNEVDVGRRSSPTFADWDGDGDLDLIVGSQDGSVYYFERVSRTSVTLRSNEDTDPFWNLALEDSYSRGRAASPAVVDWDGDNDLDLVIGQMMAGLYYFEHVPVDSLELQASVSDDPFLEVDRLGGAHLAPTIVDYDGDGVDDILLGMFNFQASGEDAVVLLFKKESNDTTKVKLQAPGDVTFSSVPVNYRGNRYHSSCSFGDWDGDGDLDFVLSYETESISCGTIRYFENVLGNWTLRERFDHDNPFWEICDRRMHHALIDWDNDGDVDFILGGDSGGLRYFEHVGANITEMTGSNNPFRVVSVGGAAPAFVDWDGDGDQDLVVGSNDGLLYYYKRISSERLEEQTGVNNPFVDVVDQVGGHTTPAFADWDGDGDMDLILGEKSGMLKFFARGHCVVTEPCSLKGICNVLKNQCECIFSHRDVDCSVCNLGFQAENLDYPLGCEKCPMGRFGQQSVCKDCAAGRVAYEGAGWCRACPRGKSPNEENSECDACAPGKFSEGDNANCSLCSGGTYSTQGSGECSTCEAGTFAASEGGSFCVRCPLGTYSRPSSSFCSTCTGGSVPSQRQETCILCEDGTYAQPGYLTCETCGSGTFAEIGSWNCTVCEAGKHSSSGSATCTTCEAGKHSLSGSSACAICEAGKHSSSGSATCTTCEAGKHSLSGSTSCTVCEAGMHSLSGSSACAMCEAGKHSSSGSAACTVCEAGKYSLSGSSACTVCKAGEHAKRGSAKCSLCAAGTYTVTAGSGCTSCPEATYSTRGSWECLKCETGERPTSDQSDCELDVAFVALLVACFIAQLVAVHPFCKNLGSRIMITDVSQMGDMAVITTNRKHRIGTRMCVHRPKVAVLQTGDITIKKLGRWPTVRVLDPMRLELLDHLRQSIHTDVNSSMGYIRAHPLHSLITVGEKYPTLLCSTIMLPVPWLLLLLLKEEDHETHLFLLDIFVASLIGAISGFWVRWSEAIVKTPLKDRLAKFREKSLKTRKVDPGPDRAVPLHRVRELLHFFRDLIGNRNAYYLASNIILPLTKQKKLSFAEYVGPERVRFFVSHYWGTSFEHFVETLERHALLVVGNQRGESAPHLKSMHTSDFQGTGAFEIAYWICFLSNNQWHLEEEITGNDWRTSSFYKAVRSAECEGTCMVLDENATPLTRAWCLFEVLQTFEREKEEGIFKGLIFCTDRGVIRKDALDNCADTCYDVALSLATRLVDVDVGMATSSNADDLEMIRRLVMEKGGMDQINMLIKNNMVKTLTEVPGSFHSKIKHILTQLQVRKESVFGTPNVGTTDMLTPGDFGLVTPSESVARYSTSAIPDGSGLSTVADGNEPEDESLHPAEPQKDTSARTEFVDEEPEDERPHRAISARTEFVDEPQESTDRSPRQLETSTGDSHISVVPAPTMLGSADLVAMEKFSL